MLCLSRQHGEKIIIGGNIIVTVVEIKNGRVRLGIEADPSMVIDREEIHLRKLAEESPQAVS